MEAVNFFGQSCKILTQNILSEDTVKQICGDSTTQYLPFAVAALAALIPTGFIGHRLYCHLTNPDLHRAAQYGLLKDVKLAISRKLDLNCRHPQTGNTALHLALASRHTGVVNALLQAGARVTAVSNNNGESPLHVACKENDPDAVERLIQKAADVNTKDVEGNTPLMVAASRGLSGNVEKLLEVEGIDLDAQNGKGETALILAAREHTEALRQLLDKGASADISDKTGQIPLHKAADQENIEALKVLLEKTKNVNLQDEEGATPLHLTAHHTSSRLKSAELLLGSLNVNPDLLNHEGESALHLACRKMTGDNKLALLMIGSKRFNLDLQTESHDPSKDAYKRNTAAHIASESKDVEILTALYAAGARTDIANREGTIAQVGQDDGILAKVYETYTVEELRAERKEGLTLIDWATIYCCPAVEKVLNSKGIYFRLTQENKAELRLKALDVMVRKGIEFFEQKIPLRIKEFRELKEDIAALKANPNANLQQQEFVDLCRETVNSILKRRDVIAQHKQANTHVFLADLLFGSQYEMEWYFKLFSSLVPEELRKRIIFLPIIMIPNREQLLIDLPPQFAVLFEQEISLRELEQYLPMIIGAMNGVERAPEEAPVRAVRVVPEADELRLA